MANNKERIKQLEKVCRLQYGMSSVVDKLRHMEESINKLSEVLLTTEVGSNSKGDHNGQFSSNKEDIVRVRKEVDRCSHPR